MVVESVMNNMTINLFLERTGENVIVMKFYMYAKRWDCHVTGRIILFDVLEIVVLEIIRLRWIHEFIDTPMITTIFILNTFMILYEHIEFMSLTAPISYELQ